jgi:hypothetical protein
MDDDFYDSYGIVLKTWFASEKSESKKNSYFVIVGGGGPTIDGLLKETD